MCHAKSTKVDTGCVVPHMQPANSQNTQIVAFNLIEVTVGDSIIKLEPIFCRTRCGPKVMAK